MSILLREISFDTLTSRYFSITQEKLSHFSVRITKTITHPDHLQYQAIRTDCDGQFVLLKGAFMARSKLEQIVWV